MRCRAWFEASRARTRFGLRFLGRLHRGLKTGYLFRTEPPRPVVSSCFSSPCFLKRLSIWHGYCCQRREIVFRCEVCSVGRFRGPDPIFENPTQEWGGALDLKSADLGRELGSRHLVPGPWSSWGGRGVRPRTAPAFVISFPVRRAVGAVFRYDLAPDFLQRDQTRPSWALRSDARRFAP